MENQLKSLNNLDKLTRRYKELEGLLVQREVIQDSARYSQYAKEYADLKDKVSLFDRLKKLESEISQIEGVLKEGHEQEFIILAKSELEDLKRQYLKVEEQLKQLLQAEDKDLNKDVIMEIRAGTGGLEASLFAADLYRMYTKYAARRSWQAEVLSSHPTELNGFKEVVLSIKGKDAFKRLKFESGVHRVQRVPTTEASGRIHTSTATVAVLEEPKEIDLAIDPKDLKIDVFRSSGPGGQSVNTADSAVRVTHLPTGMVVVCQDERSQLKNKNKALRVLRARLLDMKREEEFKKLSSTRKSQIGTGERSEKIRTYNFPDRRITEHRIGLTVYRLEEVLEGDLDEIAEGLIKAALIKEDE